MQSVDAKPANRAVDVAEAGRAYIDHLMSVGRKRTTLMAYESHLRIDLAPYFDRRALARIQPADVEAMMASLARAGKSPKTVRNAVGFLHGIFEYAIRRKWVSDNPVKLVDKPTDRDRRHEIRFLDEGELEALLAAVPPDELGRVERVMYLVAAMTGMRQGELLGLRWYDIDWHVQRVRIRRSFVRGEYTSPKSRRSSRSVPLAERLARELDALHARSSWAADNDLVFAHPATGKPIDRSRLLKRFKAALKRAGIRAARFHDLRHTFGTRMAAAGVPMRTLQEFMGHQDFKTTLIYADYAPSGRELEFVEAAFGLGTNSSTNLSATETNRGALGPLYQAESD